MFDAINKIVALDIIAKQLQIFVSWLSDDHVSHVG